MKPKGFILYKNGEYDHVSEEKMIKRLKSKMNKIDLILIPYLPHYEQLPVFIPVNPSKELLFARAEVQFVTTIYTLNLDNQPDEPCEIHQVIHEPEIAFSLFEFINILFYPSKVYGYLEMTGMCEASPMDYVNTICIDGIAIQLFDSQNHEIFYEHKLLDRAEEVCDQYFFGGDRYWSNMFDFEKELNYFIPQFSKIVEKKGYNSIGVIELQKSWCEVECEKTWSAKDLNPKALYLYHIGPFNAYALLEGNNIRLIEQTGCAKGCLFSLTDDLYSREELRYRKWGDIDCNDKILEAFSISMNNIPYYESFFIDIDTVEEVLSICIFADIFLQYIRYVLWNGIMDGDDESKNYVSALVIGDGSDFENSKKFIVNNTSDLNPNEMIDRFINLLS